jgi:RHS repeat-associated protein
MKHNLIAVALALVAIGSAQVLKAADMSLPELMSKEQLVEWTSDKSTTAEKPTSNLEADNNSTRFYTGKPYVPDAGGYLFAARTYSPQMSSWTSRDPMGFPDGANSYKYYPNPTSSFDYAGCFAWGSALEGGAWLESGNATFGLGLATLSAGVASLAALVVPGLDAVTVGISITSIATGVVGLYAAVGLIGSGAVDMQTAYADTDTEISPTFMGIQSTLMSGEVPLVAGELATLGGIISSLNSIMSDPYLNSIVSLQSALQNLITEANNQLYNPLSTASSQLSGAVRPFIPVPSDGNYE